MASEGVHKKDKPRLFGVDLTQLSTNFSLDEHPATSYVAGKTLANMQSHPEVPKLAASSASSSTSAAQGPNARVFRCRYCSKQFYSSKALGGHENVHKNRAVGQQTFDSNRRLSHNFVLERVELSYLAGETHEVPELAASASKSKSTAQGPNARVFHCGYCPKQFYSSKALGGHQNAHKNERAASSLSNGAVGQQPFDSNNRVSHNFVLEIVKLSKYRPHLEQGPRYFHGEYSSSSLSSGKRARNDIEFASSSLSSVKRARNGIDLESSSLPSAKAARNEDPQQHNTSDKTEQVELDLSLHL